MADVASGNSWAWEGSGAAGDLGTLLPLALGAIAVGGLAPGPVFAGFALTYALAAVVYRLPVPVQPMKAVSAVILASGATVPSVAAAGVMLGVVLLILGATGLVDRIARAVPQSVLTGLQTGLGLTLGLVALKLLAGAPVFGAMALAALVGLLVVRRVPAALVFLPVVAGAGWALGLPGLQAPAGAAAWVMPGWPSYQDLSLGLTAIALPQVALTLTNAVLLTSIVAGDRYGAQAARVTPRNLCFTTGAANLLLAPFGALPMCHGAGGVVAHYRFGARSWGAPAMLSLGFGLLAVLPGAGMAVVGAVPAAALGAMLMVAAVELGASRRIIDCQPSCRPVIAVTAVLTVLVGPFAGVVGGALSEAVRRVVVRRLFGVERGA